MPTGVIIAGGRSTRFGDEDKATAELAGTPMIRRVADRLTEIVDGLVVNCRADQREAIASAMAGYPHPIAFAIDPDPDRGPMAGIRTGLRAVADDADADLGGDDPEADDNEGSEAGADPDRGSVGATYGFVVACDMPFVDPEFAAYLLDRARGRDAAVPRPDEWYQTTQAVYRAEPMADACEEALAADERKIVVPLFELDDVVVVEAEEIEVRTAPATFENVNTREEFEAAERRLREADRGGDGDGDGTDAG